MNDYTNLPIDKLKRFTLPQIADCVRVHLLRDNGGIWIDADTIILTEDLPKVNLKGYPQSRNHTVGYLYAKNPNEDMFIKWSKHQDKIINSNSTPTYWDTFSNSFTDKYVKEHLEITIDDIKYNWP